MSAGSPPCPAAVTALLRVADRMDAPTFLRAYALGTVTNIASERRLRKASLRSLKRILIRESLDVSSGEWLTELLVAFGVDLSKRAPGDAQ